MFFKYEVLVAFRNYILILKNLLLAQFSLHSSTTRAICLKTKRTYSTR